jgi:alpha-amylase/alpha-mannosidase (GH57 family)
MAGSVDLFATPSTRPMCDERNFSAPNAIIAPVDFGTFPLSALVLVRSTPAVGTRVQTDKNMLIWHLTADAPREPSRVTPGERVQVRIGTFPIEQGQSVRVSSTVRDTAGLESSDWVAASWVENRGPNGYWRAELGPFKRGDSVSYTIEGEAPSGSARHAGGSFRVGPRLYLALLWHQHQPLYKDMSAPLRGAYRKSSVRLHALRDYYAMPARVAAHPSVHVTFNLTPSLLLQLVDYADHGATDEALELTLTPAETLTDEQRDTILTSFFDADRHNQILRHPRYAELFQKRAAGETFSSADLRDLQMWFNLAWFAEEFRRGTITLATGINASVQKFAEQGAGFSVAQIEEMVGEQLKIMRAVIPLHRRLQERGQIEVTTSPFYHPIVPLLIDTDRATLDRPGTSLPARFSHPEDADAQTALAIEMYREHFGRPPRGMWSPEAAVSEPAVRVFAQKGISWIASDQGVLVRSGAGEGGGYRVSDPDVLCRPYKVASSDGPTSIFFRATGPSDRIGFELGREPDHERAASTFLEELRSTYARPDGAGDRIVTVALDGENAWGGYREDASPFLHALYRLLEADLEIETVTFSEYLAGDGARELPPHPTSEQPEVSHLFTGSWIDEAGSSPGVDLGTWIGEPQENRAWDLLREARDRVTEAGVTFEQAPSAFHALYAAEGSDWFWWYGDDQSSGSDEEFDDLFRLHLRNIYRFLGGEPPASLDVHIAPHSVIWTSVRPVDRMQPADRLVVRTHCPGSLHHRVDDHPSAITPLSPVGDAVAGRGRYEVTLGPLTAPFPARITFRFECTQRDCPRTDLLCRGEEHVVFVKESF